LTMLEWYCVENAESHSATVPCENYLRMTKMVAARDKSEREAVTKAFAAVAPKTEEEMADRVRLVKGAYTAMKVAFCNVPAHLLACANPDLEREYAELSKATRLPAAALDRKAFYALSLNRKRMMEGSIQGRGRDGGERAAQGAIDNYLE